MKTCNEILLDKIFTLESEEMKAIYNNSWIADKNKMSRIAQYDFRASSKIIRDVVTGMIGEWGAYHYLSSYGIDCEKPQCGVLERKSDIWDKDLSSLESIKIKTGTNKTQTVDRSVSCKAQLLSQTKNIGKCEPSWTFQKDLSNRHGDPMLKDPLGNKLLVVSWIDDYWEKTGEPVPHRNPITPYRDGFRFCPQVTCFWWPDVFEYLDEPISTNLVGKKKCLYFKDIKHLQAKIISIDLE